MNVSENLYGRIIKAVPEGIWVVNSQGETIFCNERMAALLGTDVESLQKLSCFDPVFPEDLEGAQRQFAQQMAGGQPFDFRLRRIDGSPIWVTISCMPVYDDSGASIGLLGLFTDISERRRSETDLRDRERLLGAIFSQAAVGMAQTAPDGHWLLVNNRFCEMLGYSSTELRGMTFADITHPDDRDASITAVRQLLAGQISSWKAEKRYVRKDGGVVWGRLFTSLVRDQHNQPQYFITVVEDVTDKVHAERALWDTEQRLKLAQKAACLGVWDHDVRKDITVISEQYAELHGLPPDHPPLTHEEWLQLVHSADRERVQALVRESLDRGSSWDTEFRVVWPDGSTHWLLGKGNVLRAGSGLPVRMVGVSLDITARKQAEGMLRESEERFRTLADTAPVMIWVSGLDKLCTFFNKPWLDFTGRSMEQELGNGWATGVHPEDLERCLATYTESFDVRRSFQMEYRLRRADGEFRCILDNGTPLYRNGEFAGFIGSCLDITDQKLIEQRLRANETALLNSEQQLRALAGGLLTAQENERRRISRELHDDVTQRLAFFSMELGNLTTEIPDSLEDVRVRIRALREQALQLSGEIRQISHGLHPSVIEDFGLSITLEEFCNQFGIAKGISVEFDGLVEDSDLDSAIATCLYRVAQESLRNAVIHGHATHIRVELRVDPECVHLRVQDNGKGFRAEDARSKSGLGLISMQERIRFVHGTLTIFSQPGQGAEIAASVPLNGVA